MLGWGTHGLLERAQLAGQRLGGAIGPLAWMWHVGRWNEGASVALMWQVGGEGASVAWMWHVGWWNEVPAWWQPVHTLLAHSPSKEPLCALKYTAPRTQPIAPPRGSCLHPRSCHGQQHHAPPPCGCITYHAAHTFSFNG